MSTLRTIRTTVGIHTQLALLLGIPFEVKPHTTLNQKLNILPDTIPQGNYYPQLRYFCLGSLGHRPQVINDDVKIGHYQHQSIDCSPFRIHPFVMREIGNDLSPTERERYALRRIEEHKGVNWIVYYLRRIDTHKLKIEHNHVNLSSGIETVTPYTYNTSNLNPVPELMPSKDLRVVKSDHVDVAVNMTIEFTEEDCRELQNVSNILTDDPELRVVSEIGLVTAIDKTVNVSDPGADPFQFKEAICAQVSNIASTFHSPFFSSGGFSIQLSIGAAEPLYKLAQTER